MNRPKKLYISIVSSILAILAVTGAGAFTTMLLRRDCAAEATRVKNAEFALKRLKRENDFLNAEIAKSQDPTVLRGRAGNNLRLPDGEKVVFAYQIQENESNGAPKRIMAYRSSANAKILKTAKR